MHVLGGVASGSPDNDVLSVIVPFQNRSRTDTELSADLGGYGDLTLRRELGVCERHTTYYHGNEDGLFQARCPAVSRNAAVPESV